MDTFGVNLIIAANADFNTATAKRFIETLYTSMHTIKENTESGFDRKSLESTRPSTMFPHFEYPLHKGCKEYLEEIGLISYNPNPMCAMTAGSGPCKYAASTDNRSMLDVVRNN